MEAAFLESGPLAQNRAALSSPKQSQTVLSSAALSACQLTNKPVHWRPVWRPTAKWEIQFPHTWCSFQPRQRSMSALQPPGGCPLDTQRRAREPSRAVQAGVQLWGSLWAIGLSWRGANEEMVAQSVAINCSSSFVCLLQLGSNAAGLKCAQFCAVCTERAQSSHTVSAQTRQMSAQMSADCAQSWCCLQPGAHSAQCTVLSAQCSAPATASHCVSADECASLVEKIMHSQMRAQNE